MEEERKEAVAFKVPPLKRPEDIAMAKTQLKEIQIDLERRLAKLDEAQKISPELWKMRFTI